MVVGPGANGARGPDWTTAGYPGQSRRFSGVLCGRLAHVTGQSSVLSVEAPCLAAGGVPSGLNAAVVVGAGKPAVRHPPAPLRSRFVSQHAARPCAAAASETDRRNARRHARFSRPRRGHDLAAQGARQLGGGGEAVPAVGTHRRRTSGFFTARCPWEPGMWRKVLGRPTRRRVSRRRGRVCVVDGLLAGGGVEGGDRGQGSGLPRSIPARTVGWVSRCSW